MIHSSSTLPSYLCGAWTPPTQFRANMYRDSNCLQSLVFVRWTGWILAPTSGMVTFTISVGSNSPISETVKFYVDAREYIDTMSCHQEHCRYKFFQRNILRNRFGVFIVFSKSFSSLGLVSFRSLFCDST